jgi:hypothetical protein
MSAKSAIEKLQRVAKERETQMKTRGGSESVEEKRSRRRIEKSTTCWNIKHLVIGSEVATTFIVIFKM